MIQQTSDIYQIIDQRITFCQYQNSFYNDGIRCKSWIQDPNDTIHHKMQLTKRNGREAAGRNHQPLTTFFRLTDTLYISTSLLR